MNEGKVVHSTKIKYNFSACPDAQFVARAAVTAGASDVTLKQVVGADGAAVYIVSFRASWTIEKQIIEISHTYESDTFPYYREGCSYSREEYDLLVDRFRHWHNKKDISDELMRTYGEICEFYESRGFIPRFTDYWPEGPAMRGDGYYSPNISQSAITEGFDAEALEELQRVGAIDKHHSADEDSYVMLRDFCDEEIKRLYGTFIFFEQWRFAATLATALEEPLKAFLFERMDNSPAAALRALSGVKGLSPEHLYQRELLRAYFTRKDVEQYCQDLACWIDAAMERQSDYSKKYRVTIPKLPSYLFPEGTLDLLPLDLQILMCANDRKALEDYVAKNNHLAACILADHHRLKMWSDSSYPLDAADSVSAIQDGYWPNISHVRMLLKKYLPFDDVYASKLAEGLDNG